MGIYRTSFVLSCPVRSHALMAQISRSVLLNFPFPLCHLRRKTWHFTFRGNVAQSLLQKWFDGMRQNTWESRILKEDGQADSYGRISYQLWNVSKFGLCTDAAITGMMAPPLLELPVRI